MAVVCWLFIWNVHSVIIISSIITSICYCEFQTLDSFTSAGIWNFIEKVFLGLVGVLSWWGADLDPVTQVRTFRRENSRELVSTSDRATRVIWLDDLCVFSLFDRKKYQIWTAQGRRSPSYGLLCRLHSSHRLPGGYRDTLSNLVFANWILVS